MAYLGGQAGREQTCLRVSEAGTLEDCWDILVGIKADPCGFDCWN